MSKHKGYEGVSRCIVMMVILSATALVAAQGANSDEWSELRKGAEQGDVKAQSELGMRLMVGKGIPKNMPEAYKWLRKAADQGDAIAQCNLGSYYSGGDGVPKDDVEGAKWVRKAADQGFAGGQYDLGLRYHNGHGVPKDDVQAYMWLNLASQTMELARKTRETFGSKMTPQQIAEAKKLSEDWKPTSGHGAAKAAPSANPNARSMNKNSASRTEQSVQNSPRETATATQGAAARATNQSIRVDFAEADMHFTYRGKPIHPGLLCEFLTPIADKGAPLTVSVDVAAAFGTNEYYASADKDETGAIVCQNMDRKTRDGYRWFGRLSDGSHIVYAWQDDGNRVFPRSLFFVKFAMGKGFMPDGTGYDRLLMMAIRWYAPFDARSKVKVSNDGVVISMEGKAPVTLKAPDEKEFAGSGDDIRDGLIEIDKSFTYKGKPIHPSVIQEFAGYLSDKGFPLSVSVDLAAAAGSNRYFDGNVKQPQPGFYSVDSVDGRGFFGYRWCGKMADGTHVVRTFSSGGGSGVFEDLRFLQFADGRGYAPDGSAYNRLLVTAARWFPLGDRPKAEIQVFPDKVVVSQGADGKGPVTLRMAK